MAGSFKKDESGERRKIDLVENSAGKKEVDLEKGREKLQKKVQQRKNTRIDKQKTKENEKKLQMVCTKLVYIYLT